MKFTPKDIYEKSFSKRFKGYDTLEVDTFLDDIMSDYEAYAKQILNLKKEIIKLNAQIEELSANKNELEENTSNFDVLKRISNLEKQVFGSKLNNL